MRTIVCYSVGIFYFNAVFFDESPRPDYKAHKIHGIKQIHQYQVISPTVNSNMVIALKPTEWARLSQNARPKTVDIKLCSAKPSDYNEYLKRESHELSKHWTNTVEKNREKKVREHQMKKLKKQAEGTY